MERVGGAHKSAGLSQARVCDKGEKDSSQVLPLDNVHHTVHLEQVDSVFPVLDF